MRQFLENLTGLSIYPLAGIVLFTLFFTGVLVLTFTTRKDHFRSMSALPLEEGTDLTPSSLHPTASQSN